mmetsp:Transcript_5168/g.7881  ORF Transcript_5168/g.7881 Transcript_5168/m.7881 type:complete len:881 (-) Transcript_5168:436-3078(-)|eukprot:scaffold4628_cov146-Skeletonema_dohrnii-CCMP3373.AAC.20
MLTLPLNAAESNLSLTGGKGHNLSILSRGGISVPGGFVVTTSAYHDFVSQNNKKLLTKIEATLTSHVDDLDEASAIIQAEFRKQKFSTTLRNEIAERLSELDPQVNLAIRSSATCEDMPDASFAGQHDTYLNIPHSQVEENIVECFASLFTPRAISYRKRNNLSEVDAGMAVVCQCMASNQTASGVLFTANPLTGRRNESALEAIPGLGEALVSGITEPDRYVVSRKNGEMTIKDKRIGAKSKTILAADGGGVKEETSLAASCEVLTDEEVKSIIDLGQNVQDLYGEPQDIEWTKSAEGKFSVVQSRPITTLFPLPNVSMHPLQVFFSFNSVQGIIEPIYPAGQEAMRRGVLGGLLRWITWGRHGKTGEFIQTVGERLYINITNVLQNTLGRKILTTAMTGIDPASAMAIEELIEEDELEINSGVGSFFLIRLVSLYSLIMPRIIMSVLFPAWMRDRLYHRIEKIVESVEEKVSNASGLSALVDVQIDVLQSYFRTMLPHILPRIGAGLAPLAILGQLSAHLPNGKDLVLTITRALPHNITTEMDLKLWSAAKVIQSDMLSLHHFKSTDADRLALEYLHGELPDVAQDAVSLFMSEYGMRGLYEIDFGRPRWREEPAPLMNTLKSYVEINGDHAPDKVFANGEKVAEAAITELGKQLNKPRLVSFLANRARQLAGLRELPKFTAIRMMGIIRAKMLIEGEKLVSIGALEDAKDLFYLETFEIKALVNDELADCKRIIIERKAAMAQESKRTRLPRIITSDGFAYFGGTAKIVEGANVFSGEPVSPGVYEGRIRVVHDPSKTKMTQGEILCCHGTDPSWTPLFLSSGALVMEVGGLMTHGSVVAREYGIPAVVGLEKVTERLTTGQLVRVDGSSGTIEVLE